MSSQWHIDKTISVGHLISTVIIAISVFSWASAVDRRVEQNAQAIAFVREQIKQERVRTDNALGDLKTNLRDINNKLDRLIEQRK
ncbi:hypothetical protein NF212_06460 [Parasalinivibrio latis]|uniref:hypothetical protein n=1 Tax=Parasalinivibrio latis TaxID=2952610 RepID=UPI0030E4F6DE